MSIAAEVHNSEAPAVQMLAERALTAISAGSLGLRFRDSADPGLLIEEIHYQGRRLANLGLSFSEVRQHLQERHQQADADILRFVESEVSEAFHQVREMESRAYLRLFHAEVACRTVEELLEAALEAFADYARAAEGRAWLFAEGALEWTLAASTQKTAGPLRCRSNSVLDGALRSPDCQRGLLGHSPDPTWARRFMTVWTFPIAAGSELLGVLEFGFTKAYEWLPRERDLLTAAARLSALAAKKALLLKDLAEREQDVRRLLDELQTVEEAERKRIGRDLHDEAGQSLLCLRLQLELLERELPDEDKARARLADVRSTTDKTLEEIRRVMAALTPSVLEHSGLCAALRQLVKRFKGVHEVVVRADLPEEIRLPAKMELAAYRMVQELLNNVGKHARARKVHLVCQVADEGLQITVADDGIGFAADDGVRRRECFGLAGLQDRARLLGGTVEIRSSPRGGQQDDGLGGTTVRITIPLPGQTG